MKNLIYASVAILFLFASCDDDDDKSMPMSSITQKFENLPDLGSDYVYEGWLIGTGTNPDKTSTGRFTHVQGKNYKSDKIDMSKVDEATAYVLTIEPKDETGADLSSPSGLFSQKVRLVVIWQALQQMELYLNQEV